MKVAVFLIALCLFLMGGVDRVFAGNQARSCCYAHTYHHEILQEGKSGDFANVCSVKQNFFGTGNDHLLPDSFEEEDNDETSHEKFRLAVKYRSQLSYHSILNYLYNCGEAPPSFNGTVADKYIVQRVLRV
ncbi:MAG: hypothetical protein EOO01_09790 [Chitinophagaceae bacterium]|nr:MAG: hypothetical protein EOO01_09790 [Chitinophagaceae bacterium]